MEEKESAMNRREFMKTLLTAAAVAPVAGLGEDGGAKAVAAKGPQVARRQYRDTAATLPLLGFGNMRLPKLPDGKIDYATGRKMYEVAFASGVNYFDTAYMYHDGESENFVGSVLADYPRDSFYLADKMPMMMVRSAADIPRIFEDQLKKCRVKYFDFYLLHNMGATSWKKTQRLKALEFLKKMKAEGKIRRLGFSFHDSPSVLKEIIPAYPWDFAQIQLNYLDWTAYRSKEQYELLTAAKIPVVVMEPLRGGQLARLNPQAVEILRACHPEDTPVKWAFRFVASLPNVLCILSGMSALPQIQENVQTFHNIQPLTDAEREVLQKALVAYRLSGEIACTNCRYCQPCPAGVAIPDNFAAYNSYRVHGRLGRFNMDYGALDAGTRAEDCVRCNACLPKCPQHLPIPDLLAKIAAVAKSGRGPQRRPKRT